MALRRMVMASALTLSLSGLASHAVAQDFGRILGRAVERAAERVTSRAADDLFRPEAPAPRSPGANSPSATARHDGASIRAPEPSTVIGHNVTPEVAVQARDLTRAESRIVLDRLKGAGDPLEAYTDIDDVRGYSLRTSLSTISPWKAGAPAIGQWLTLVTYPTDQTRLPDGSPVDCPSRDGRLASHCGPGLTIRINDPLAAVASDAGEYRDDMVSLPVTAPPRHNGFDVFRNQDRVVLTATRPGGPPLFVPVTRQRYLEVRATDQAARELAGLSATEHGEPACLSGRSSPILSACRPEDHYYATVNPAYFDMSKGRVAVQLITFDYFERNTPRHQVIRNAMNQLQASHLTVLE